MAAVYLWMFWFYCYIGSVISAQASSNATVDKRVYGVDDESGEFDYGLLHVHRFSHVYFQSVTGTIYSTDVAEEGLCFVQCIRMKRCKVITIVTHSNGRIKCQLHRDDYYLYRHRLVYYKTGSKVYDTYVLDVSIAS